MSNHKKQSFSNCWKVLTCCDEDNQQRRLLVLDCVIKNYINSKINKIIIYYFGVGMMKALTHKEVKEYIYTVTNGEYELINEYVNDKTYITLIHNKCGKQYSTRFSYFKRGDRHTCWKITCDEDFVNKVKKLVGDKYTFLSPFEKSSIKIPCRHNDCGYIWEITPNNFISKGCRCPKCKSAIPRGEKNIIKWLENNHFDYEHQFSFKDSSIKNLSFDFRVKLDDNKFVLIEFDGEQHYKPKFGDDGREFKKQLERDRNKNNYCKINNIPLLRIPYKYRDTVDIILEDFFTNNNVQRLSESNR
ncbi:putative homing endonuclease [Bacillus phage vB_BspM_Internexus]|nr:putative homing endonuclease [Bacillus phage vB_BspM_Internexus]